LAALIANLESGFVAAIQKILAVEGGCGCNAVDFSLNSLNIGVERSAVTSVNGAI
jgi:hypothetical protein